LGLRYEQKTDLPRIKRLANIGTNDPQNFVGVIKRLLDNLREGTWRQRGFFGVVEVGYNLPREENPMLLVLRNFKLKKMKSGIVEWDPRYGRKESRE
jgi:hypothetical protein